MSTNLIVKRLLEDEGPPVNGPDDDDVFDARQAIFAKPWLARVVSKYGFRTDLSGDGTYYSGAIPCKPFVKVWHRKPYTVDAISVRFNTMAFYGDETKRGVNAQGMWIYLSPASVAKWGVQNPDVIGKTEYKLKYWSVPHDKAEVLADRIMAVIHDAGYQGYDSFERIIAKIKADLRPYRGWAAMKARAVTADPSNPPPQQAT